MMTITQREIFISELVDQLEKEVTMGRCPEFKTGVAGIICHAENMADRIDQEWDYVPALNKVIAWAIMATKFWLKGRR